MARSRTPTAWLRSGCYNTCSASLAVSTYLGRRCSMRGSFRLRGWRRGFLQRRVDQLLKVGEAYGAADSMAIDEEKRSAVYSQAIAFLAVGLDGGFEAVAVQVFREARKVELQLLRFGD